MGDNKKRFDVRHFATGGISGAVSRTLTSPVERLKILRQLSAPQYKGLSIMGSFKQMYKLEGVRGFFKGNGLNVVRIVPFSAYEFFFYDFYMRHLHTQGHQFKSKFLCGALTGMTASTLTYPLDLMRTIKSIRVQENPSILHLAKQIYFSTGLTGFYRGWIASLIGITPYIAIKMSTFDYLRVRYLPSRDAKWFHTINLTLGGLAGCTALTITYPTDLIRRHLQMQSVGTQQYSGFVDVIRQLWAKEGYRGFYKGMAPTYLKVGPSTAILFMCNEALKRFFSII